MPTKVGKRKRDFHLGQSFSARKQAGYSDAVKPFEISLAVPGKPLSFALTGAHCSCARPR